MSIFKQAIKFNYHETKQNKTKQNVIILFSFCILCFGFNHQLFSQNFIHVYNQDVNLEEFENAKFLTKFIESQGGHNLKLAKINGLLNVYKKGVMKFKTNSSSFKNANIYPLKVDYSNPNNYAWYGISENQDFSLFVSSKEGEIIGKLADFENDEEYYFIPAKERRRNGRVKIIIFQPIRALINSTVVAPFAAAEDPYGCDDDCPSQSIDILFLLSDGAQNWLVNNGNSINYLDIFTSELNNVFTNSNINQSFNYTYDYFTSSNNTNNCQALAQSLGGDGAESLRQQHGADIVVYLGPPNLSLNGVNGCAADFGPDYYNAYAVFPIGQGFSNYLFVHEMGHLFGCHHQDDLQATDCANGYKIEGILSSGTIGCGSVTRIPFFSDPNISIYIGSTKYDVGGCYANRCSNNAGKIRTTKCLISRFNDSFNPQAGINYTIDECNLSLSASFQSSGTFTYIWHWSVDGLFSNSHPGNLVGYGQNLTMSDPLSSNCTSFFVQVSIFSNGSLIAKTTRKITGGVCTQNCCACDNSSPFRIEDRSESTLEINENENENVEYIIYNILGEKIMSIADPNVINRSNLSSGIYLIYSSNTNFPSVEKIYIHEN